MNVPSGQQTETNSAATTYEGDVVAWASEQAQLLRERRFDQLDIASQGTKTRPFSSLPTDACSMSFCTSA
ncbi:MAG: DUF29 family protein [Gammaproteobacteria bacterium]